MSEEEKNAAPVQEEGFNRDEIDAKVISLLGLATIVVVVGSILGIQFYYDTYYDEEVYIRVLEPVAGELLNLRATEDQHLHSYEYIDRNAGKVRLTIERSMELLAAEYESGELKYPAEPYAVKAEGAPAAE